MELCGIISGNTGGASWTLGLEALADPDILRRRGSLLDTEDGERFGGGGGGGDDAGLSLELGILNSLRKRGSFRTC